MTKNANLIKVVSSVSDAVMKDEVQPKKEKSGRYWNYQTLVVYPNSDVLLEWFCTRYGCYTTNVELTKKRNSMELGRTTEKSIFRGKTTINLAPVLTFYDSTKPVVVKADTGNYGVGTTLCQKVGGEESLLVSSRVHLLLKEIPHSNLHLREIWLIQKRD